MNPCLESGPKKNSGLVQLSYIIDCDKNFFLSRLYLLFHQKVNNKPTLITNYSNNNLEPRRSYLANQFSFLIATLCEGSIFHDLCYGKNKLSLFLFQLKKEEFYMPTFQKRKLCSLWHFFYSYFFF